MHAYKDAIRRTGGAYVLYPGKFHKDKPVCQKGFHEIIPGLGAFPIKPSITDSGIGELKAFLLEITDHFINRASQKEKIAYKTYDTFKKPPESDNIIKDPIPESFNNNRDLIPDDTFILIGYYASQDQYKWIKRYGLYNFRMDSDAGSLVLDKETVSSKYLLLHTAGDKHSGDLWRIISKGPKVFSREGLIRKGYPSPKKDYYLVIQIEPVPATEFGNAKWDFKKLKNYAAHRASANPYTANLTELMKYKIR